MEPKMRRIMERLRDEDADYYFKLSEDDKEIVIRQIATKVVNETINMIHNYTREEFGTILELSIKNLQSLESTFVENELYSQAQIMKDTIKMIEGDLEHFKIDEKNTIS